MKSRFSLFVLLACFCALLSPALGQDATAFAIADASTGHILKAKKEDKRLQIASLTKIATALVVQDWLDVGKRDAGILVTIPPGALMIDPANPIGFQPGDQMSVRDLLYAMLIQSDNIAAYALADYVGRDLQRNTQSAAKPVDLFVAQMNALARKLGMKHTTFLNPHGLDTVETPTSTARDLVLLTSAALQRSSFRFYVSQHERRITRIAVAGRKDDYRLVNTNELLGIDSIDGVKTGQSKRAGQCLIISAARPHESIQNPDGSYTVTARRLIVVVLGSENRFNDARQLLNNGWSLYDEWAAKGRPLEK